MARANRHHLPGYVWHITHRCHKREFLLKFEKDKRRWIHWLFEAKKRFGLKILDFTVTSNHIHLLVYDGKVNIIPKSIQLIAGRTGREYNQRKNRKGAFWEDRYHATAVKTGNHLIRCLAYIDLNMVRAGVVRHPGEWMYGWYHEIQNPKQRYSLINRQKLTALLGIKDNDQLYWILQWIMRKTVELRRKRKLKRYKASPIYPYRKDWHSLLSEILTPRLSFGSHAVTTPRPFNMNERSAYFALL